MKFGYHIKYLSQYFLDSIKFVLSEVDSKNFYNYQFIYYFLWHFCSEALKSNQEKLALDILDTIYLDSTKIFLNLPKQNLSKYNMIDPVQKNEDRNGWKIYEEFKTIFIEPLIGFNGIVSYAISHEQVHFLKDINLFHRLVDRNMNSLIQVNKLDGKIFEIYKDAIYYLVESEKTIMKKDELFSFHLSDVGFFYNNDEVMRRYKYYTIFHKYYLLYLIGLFEHAISENKINHDMTFDIFWNKFYKIENKTNFYEEGFKEALVIYLHLFKKVIDTNKNESLIKDMYYRLQSAKDEIKKEPMLQNTKDFLEQNISKFLEKFPDLKKIETERFDRIDNLDFIKKYTLFEN